ncbi:MAG: hypothetical protein JXA96_11590 [Sedimentisphaerales bacterium]|nr:hypothetical protein [Sedimentisphaerales bacterium]
MFDLNEQIKKWRGNLNTSQSLESKDIDELESHLREEIEELTLSDLSEQEAFLVATHRLGQVDFLSEEFAKVNAGVIWRKRFFWSGIVVLLWIIMNYIVNSLSQLFMAIATLIGARGYTLNIIDNFSKVILFVLAILVLFSIAKQKNLNNSFRRLMNNFWSKVILFFAVFIIVIVTYALGKISSVINARLLGAEEFGQVAMLNSFASLVWRVLMPIILLVGIIMLRPSKLQKV